MSTSVPTFSFLQNLVNLEEVQIFSETVRSRDEVKYFKNCRQLRAVKLETNFDDLYRELLRYAPFLLEFLREKERVPGGFTLENEEQAAWKEEKQLSHEMKAELLRENRKAIKLLKARRTDLKPRINKVLVMIEMIIKKVGEL